ncbi:unnamed protein product [Rotaria magnacalcarata]|uniref:Proteasome activator subunit 4 n=1 Tax=Rotaria magnacalcarata TaxID=392030 RepID=A0A816UF99_9BILA|nr:unnamed protein product [Rotaria magnacalcarata]
MMNSQLNTDEQFTEMCNENLQRPNIYNEYLPCQTTIKQQASRSFEQIRENLSRTIQSGEFQPGFRLWSFKLREFILLYGHSFTKVDHIKFVQFYVSIISITNLNCADAMICFEVLNDLLQKTRLIDRNDLTISWRTLYRWAEFIIFCHDSTYALVTLPKNFDIQMFLCIRNCSPYFSEKATQEILDEIRPQICHIDSSSMSDAIKILESFLPINLPPSLHSQGFQLWLSELFDIWQSIYNNTPWEIRLIQLFARLAWHNIGYIDWEPWIAKIFTRFLRGFSLPIGTMALLTTKNSHYIPDVSRWIIGMIGNGSSCLEYLRDLFIAIKSFYYPSNTGKFQKRLVDFVLNLARYFVERIHLEKKQSPVWFFALHESYRLTEQDVTNFVDCVKEYAFMSIFNKDYVGEAAEACQYLAMLRPESIVTPIVDKLFLSIDNLTEAHRFTSLMQCLKRITRSLVRQTSSFSQGQKYILPLLTAILPGIDLNDFEKTNVTLEVFDAIFMLISCVDCSSAVNIRNDLTEIEKEVCLSTAKFEEFIENFLDRIFQMINILSTDLSDTLMNNEDRGDHGNLGVKMTSIMTSIIRQCSNNISQMVTKKVTNFISGSIFLPSVRHLVGGLIRPIVKWYPTDILKCLLSQTCESIKQILDKTDISQINNPNGDLELNWYLILFAELVQARGDTLLIYQENIKSVFHRCIRILHKDSYQAIALAIKSLLLSLLNIYSISRSLTRENEDDSFVNFLPIRAWGQNVDFDRIQVQYHIPNDEEIDFACDFVNTFMYPELTLLKENFQKISKDERRRSLAIVYSIAVGCLRIVPRMESKEIQDIALTLVPCKLESHSLYPTYYKQSSSKFRENIRMRLLLDIGQLLDMLIENQSDDVVSIKNALSIYVLPTRYYGTSSYNVSQMRRNVQSTRKLFRNEIIGERDNPVCLVMNQIELQIEEFELYSYRILTEIDKQVELKLFDLSINRYSEVRRYAQLELFFFLVRHYNSWEVIVDRVADLLNSSKDTDDNEIKGCLHILNGDSSFFLLTKNSWTMMKKLWPAIVRRSPMKKLSVQRLIQEIKKKIETQFFTIALVDEINQVAVQAASTLWRPLESNEIQIGIEIREKRHRINIQSYNHLIDDLCLLLNDQTLSWGQKKIGMFLLCLILQKDVPIPFACINTCLDFLIHDNIELRKHAVKAIAAFCRLQKLPLTYVEKSLDEIFPGIDRSTTTGIQNRSQPGNRDDNLWLTYNDYKAPETQTEWEQICFLDKIFHGYYQWPKTIKYALNKRERYTGGEIPTHVSIILDRFLDKDFVTKLSKCIIFDEGDIDFDKIRFLMYKGLFRNFGLAFVDNFIEQVYILVREQTREKYEGSHRAAAEIVAGMIRGSKYWTLAMLEELWQKLTPLLTEVTNNLNNETYSHWGSCFRYCLNDTDPRRMFQPINFISTLINCDTVGNTFNEASRWYLVQSLRVLQWRIPSIWYLIYEQAKELLDHPSKLMRERIATLLSISFAFDRTFFNGASVRHPNIHHFVNMMREKLHKAIEIYERKPLINHSGSSVELDIEARQALNLIETVIEFHLNLFDRCNEPIKEIIVQLFPYLCEIESIVTNDDTFRKRLTIARTRIGMAYLHVHLLETLIQQLEYVCTTRKWHARRSAIEFVQNLVFCNLFNVRCYAKRLHQLVYKCLCDEQLEVRLIASKTLSGFYQCGYLTVTEDDLKHFLEMSNTNYFTESDGKKVISTKDTVRRHSGILGLCAIVLASPYDVSSHVPEVLMVLCKHSHDPELIQKSIKECFSEFRRTHYDSWHEHRANFTDDQLEMLADVLVSHSYYT